MLIDNLPQPYYIVYMASCDGRAIEFECRAWSRDDAEDQAREQYEDARIEETERCDDGEYDEREEYDSGRWTAADEASMNAGPDLPMRNEAGEWL